MNVHLLRHSTIIINIAGLKILVDPMFAAARTADPITNSGNALRNPLVDLPLDEEMLGELIGTIDSVIVTHLHNDHWDARARELLPKSVPIFCQPEDSTRIEEAGFEAVYPVLSTIEWQGMQLIRTGGQHGHGKIGELMAPVSGFILQAAGKPGIYIAGDTLWCTEVAQAVEHYEPEVIVLNAGAAQFIEGGPITMTADDVITVANAQPEAAVIAVHMEAINHCLMSRAELKAALAEAGVASRVLVPEDGETLAMNSSLKRILSAFMDQVWNKGDFGRIEAYVAPCYEIRHDPGDPWDGQRLNNDAFVERVLYSRNAFPDLNFAIQEMIEEDGRVAASWIMSGTHEGDLPQLPASGQPFSISGMTIYYFEGNKLIGHSQAFDRLGFLSQIGHMG